MFLGCRGLCVVVSPRQESYVHDVHMNCRFWHDSDGVGMKAQDVCVLHGTPCYIGHRGAWHTVLHRASWCMAHRAT